jgi:predicted TIM-barrel fold metal-dependent hydrolase
MLVERFGIQRLLWGSNYPAHPARFGDLAARLRIMQDDFAFLSKAEQSAFFGDNAVRLWPVLRPES